MSRTGLEHAWIIPEHPWFIPGSTQNQPYMDLFFSILLINLSWIARIILGPPQNDSLKAKNYYFFNEM